MKSPGNCIIKLNNFAIKISQSSVFMARSEIKRVENYEFESDDILSFIIAVILFNLMLCIVSFRKNAFITRTRTQKILNDLFTSLFNVPKSRVMRLIISIETTTSAVIDSLELRSCATKVKFLLLMIY